MNGPHTPHLHLLQQPFAAPDAAPFVHKQESPPDAPRRDDKKAKPAKTLNRVPRACNACRKQKMRCEGADAPPCRRCRHAGLECLFEKPSREPTLTGEAGLERIRSLEAQVSDIRTTQHSIHATLEDLVAQLRSSAGLVGPAAPSPAFRLHHAPSDSPYPVHSPASASAPTPAIDPALQHQPSPALLAAKHPPAYPFGPPYPPRALPPLAALHDMAPPAPRARTSPSRRTHPARNDNGKRPLPSSNVTSANSSDDDDNAELPASGLVAPWEVLRGLADAAAARAAKEHGESETPSRTRSHSPIPVPPHFHTGHNGNDVLNGSIRPSKRRKTNHRGGRDLAFPDVVTKNIITEQEARDLFDVFYHGCSTFLSVFDAEVDTFDALHERSPFAVDCICMVAARVKCGGGPPSDTFRRCLEQVQAISCATLFSPVSRQEAVQAMVLVSGWSDNGWLSGGHAVRMALELGMNTAWPRLLRRMQAGKATTSHAERELVIAARTWFCLYLFEHQMSYGVGRPAILRFDDSVRDCRLFLGHPLSIKDDMRLVSTVELMVLRENVQARLEHAAPGDATYTVLRDADREFRTWYDVWDKRFSQQFPEAVFYRQSLQIQHSFAELFHNATALRGLNRPADVAGMPPAQRRIAVRSIQTAKAVLEISLGSSEYRENLKYAVHYTHATATFGASLLIRLARLLPDDCDLRAIKKDVEELANVLEQTPAGRYARSLRYMLRRASERRVLPADPALHPALRGTPAHPRSIGGDSDVFPGGGGSASSVGSGSGSGAQWYGGDALAQFGSGSGSGSDAEMHAAWATMELNTGAVLSNGMEAYMIPVVYDQQQEALRQIW